MPTRCPPDVVLSSPHDADPLYHQDWTKVPGSNWDDEKRKIEYERRERREILIRAKLTEGFSVFYPSSGNSMWPLIQSGDFCTFHPIQAVTAGGTARGGEQITIQKERSEIGVGDVVFCKVQPTNLYYAHVVGAVNRKPGSRNGWRSNIEPEYQIHNITGRYNGYCYREHIFGILVAVQVRHSDGQYYSRPHPKALFQSVSRLVQDDKWCKAAEKMCIASHQRWCDKTLMPRIDEQMPRIDEQAEYY